MILYWRGQGFGIKQLWIPSSSRHMWTRNLAYQMLIPALEIIETLSQLRLLGQAKPQGGTRSLVPGGKGCSMHSSENSKEMDPVQSRWQLEVTLKDLSELSSPIVSVGNASRGSHRLYEAELPDRKQVLKASLIFLIRFHWNIVNYFPVSLKHYINWILKPFKSLSSKHSSSYNSPKFTLFKQYRSFCTWQNFFFLFYQILCITDTHTHTWFMETYSHGFMGFVCLFPSFSILWCHFSIKRINFWNTTNSRRHLLLSLLLPGASGVSVLTCEGACVLCPLPPSPGFHGIQGPAFPHSNGGNRSYF